MQTPSVARKEDWQSGRKSNAYPPLKRRDDGGSTEAMHEYELACPSQVSLQTEFRSLSAGCGTDPIGERGA